MRLYCAELEDVRPLEIRKASCYSKKRYDTEDLAKQVAHKCRRERGAVLRIYHCQDCYGYHLTSKGTFNGRD